MKLTLGLSTSQIPIVLPNKPIACEWFDENQVLWEDEVQVVWAPPECTIDDWFDEHSNLWLDEAANGWQQ